MGWRLIVLVLATASAATAADDRRLVDAVKRRDGAAARALLAQRVDVRVKAPDGSVALHWAVHHDDEELARLIVRAGADVNAANDYGVTSLALAAANGSAPLVRLLLEAGASPMIASSSGETPLMAASRTGVISVVAALLERGADMHARDIGYGQTALMWAISERHSDVARLLLEHGADPKVRSTGGYSPLLFAARVGDLESARLLLAAGASPDDAATDGTSVLLTAVVRGHVPLAIELLERGANPNADATGYTALHWAAGSWETELTGPNGIDARADPEWAALAGIADPAEKLALVRALLAHGADPNAALAKTPPRVGYTQLVVEHRVAGTSPFAGATPFLLAAMAGDVDVMGVLVERGADPRRTAKDGTTALMVAAGLGRYLAESRVTTNRSVQAVRFALAQGIDVNATNEAGSTALHGAALIKADEVVELLVVSGATLDGKNARGQTPLMLADTIRAGSATVASRTPTGDLLRKLGAK
jgi:ankyrin repeat protein